MFDHIDSILVQQWDEDASATSVQAPKSPSKLSEKQTPELTAHM